jgi:hypothetical protein
MRARYRVLIMSPKANSAFLQLYDEGLIPVKALTSRRHLSNISCEQANMVSMGCKG